jgi:DNA-binding HxlR family transcriptional regulator
VNGPTWDDPRVARHGQYCPVSFAADVLGDRWTLLIVREMIGGATRFNEMERVLPRVSRSLLAQRLRQLERVGIIEAVPIEGGRGNTYHLTQAGKDLEPVIMVMGEWAIRWIIENPLALLIPGAKNRDQAMANAGALTFSLEPAEIDALALATRKWRG